MQIEALGILHHNAKPAMGDSFLKAERDFPRELADSSRVTTPSPNITATNSPSTTSSTSQRLLPNNHYEVHYNGNTSSLEKERSSGVAHRGVLAFDSSRIKSICMQSVPGWAAYDYEQIQVEPILSGLTNKLFSVHILSKTKEKLPLRHKRVLFRVYGENTQDFYDSKFEVEVFIALGKYHFAPSLIATFEGGRIEEWLLGVPLKVENLQNPSIGCTVATLLGHFHLLHNSVPDFSNWPRIPFLFPRLRNWRDRAVKIMSSSFRSSHEKVPFWSYILEESYNIEAFVMSKCSQCTPAMDVVFCHNDVQENNIMKLGSNLRLVDFEYSSFNYAGFDLACFFTECTIDYTVSEPPCFAVNPNAYFCLEYRKLFASIYLSQYSNKPILPSANIINDFLNEIEVFVLAAHMLWFFWAIIRYSASNSSTDDFDSLSYANARASMYHTQKRSLE